MNVALDQTTVMAFGTAVVVGGMVLNIGSQLIVKYLTERRGNGNGNGNVKNAVTFESLTKYCSERQAQRDAVVEKQFEHVVNRLEQGDKKFDTLHESVAKVQTDLTWVIRKLDN